MNSPKDIFNELKNILEHSSAPSQLDDHPWTKSLLAQSLADPEAQASSPGYQLLRALNISFRETQPGIPPRQGKRLDTRWGEFAMLGAMYFAPIEFGSPRPASLQDAWGRLDDVILAYEFGDSASNLPQETRRRYFLASNEVEAAPVSTLSDWHVRGLERLAERLIERERH